MRTGPTRPFSFGTNHFDTIHFGTFQIAPALLANAADGARIEPRRSIDSRALSTPRKVAVGSTNRVGGPCSASPAVVASNWPTGRWNRDVNTPLNADRMSLEALLAAVLDVERLEPSASRDELDAWDSLAHLSVVSAVEETYGVTFSSADMRTATSVVAIRELLAARGVDA